MRPEPTIEQGSAEGKLGKACSWSSYGLTVHFEDSPVLSLSVPMGIPTSLHFKGMLTCMTACRSRIGFRTNVGSVQCCDLPCFGRTKLY